MDVRAEPAAIWGGRVSQQVLVQLFVASVSFGNVGVARGQSASAPAPDDHEDEVRTREPMSLKLTDLALELERELDQRRVRTNPPGSFTCNTRQADRTWRLEEIARLSLEGAAANPDLFSFGGTIGLGLDQKRFSEIFEGRRTVDHSDGTLAEYDLRADLFRAGKVSGSVLGLSTHDRYSHPFLPSLRKRRTDLGTTWTYNDDTFPMELRAEHRDTDRDGIRRLLGRSGSDA